MGNNNSLTLTNNTGDTLKYVNMSCSNDEIFATNTPEVGMFRHGCDKNVVKVYAIPPHGSEVINCALEVTKKARTGKKFKIGIQLIDGSKYDFKRSLFDDIANHKGKTNGQMKFT